MTDNSQKMYSIKNSTEEDDDGIYQQNMRNRCGEIFFEDDKFKYYCLFCQEDFGKIPNFISHLYTTHLFMDPPFMDPPFMDPPLSVDDKSQEVNIIDYAKSDDIKHNNELDENNDIFYISENEDQKFVTKHNIEDDQISLLELTEKGENLLKECKVEMVEMEMKTENNFKQDIQIAKNQCELCFKILSNERSLKRHKFIHIKHSKSTVINKYNFPRGEDGRFHCDLCTSSYSRIDRLRHHIENHWGSTNQAKCDICSKILSSKFMLKAHIMRVHIGKRPYKCDHCPAAFADRSNFDRHLRIHLRDKRYNCDYCDKTFIQRSEKKIHERMVHTKERPYQCEICGKKFFNTVTLNDHKKRHTNTRPFECEICKKRFYNGYLLKDHKISHSNEKPHTCDICSAKFARRKALTQHIKIHSNVKEYVCTICNKAFAQSAGLYSHMKSHIGSLETHSILTT